MTIIHFICRGNAYRSIMAEAYLKSLKLPGVTVLSSGTVADRYREDNEKRMPRILAFLDEQHIATYAKKHPEQLTQERINAGTITICMNQRVVDEGKELGKLPADTRIWDVADNGEGTHIVKPGEDPYKYIGEIYQEIVDNIDRLVKELKR